MGSSECEHKWVYMTTHYSKEELGYGQCITYKRLDVLFCEKCCSTKEILKEETMRLDDGAPLWWIH